MKKFNLAALAVLDLLLLSSCSKESKGIVIEKTQNMLDDAPTALEGYEYLEGVGSWLSAETEYKSSPYDNIVSIKGNYFSITNDNIYFQLKKEESKRDETGYYYTLGDPIYAYISGQTGEKHFICPDPLCTHGAYSGCQYLNLGNLTFSSSDTSLMYATRSAVEDGVFYPTVYEINNSAATITPIYKPDDKSEGLDMIYFNLMFEKDGKLYFIYNSQYEYVNENGETEYDEKAKLMSLDLKTKQTEVLNEDLSTRVGLMGEVWDKLLFGDGDTLECITPTIILKTL